MTKIFCDICEREVKDTTRVKFLDGEHPHNGSTMHKYADVCYNCLQQHTNVLESRMEFDDFRGEIKVKNS